MKKKGCTDCERFKTENCHLKIRVTRLNCVIDLNEQKLIAYHNLYENAKILISLRCHEVNHEVSDKMKKAIDQFEEWENQIEILNYANEQQSFDLEIEKCDDEGQIDDHSVRRSTRVIQPIENFDYNIITMQEKIRSQQKTINDLMKQKNSKKKKSEVLNQSINGQRKQLQCPYPKCGFRVKVDFANLKRHLSSHYNWKQFQCEKCKKRFTTAQTKNNHQANCDGQNDGQTDSQQDGSQPQDQIFRCYFCKFKTKFWSNFTNHLKHEHIGEIQISVIDNPNSTTPTPATQNQVSVIQNRRTASQSLTTAIQNQITQNRIQSFEAQIPSSSDSRMNSDSVNENWQDNLGYQLANSRVPDIPKIKSEFEKETRIKQEFNIRQDVDVQSKSEKEVKVKEEYQGSWSAKIMQRLVQSGSSKNYRCPYSDCTFACLKNEDYNKHLIICHRHDQVTKASTASTPKAGSKTPSSSPKILTSQALSTCTETSSQGSSSQGSSSQGLSSQGPSSQVLPSQVPSSQNKFKCPRCSAIYMKEKMLQAHMRLKKHFPLTEKQKAAKKVKKTKQVNPDDDFKHECNVMGCFIRCRTRWDLRNHQIRAHYDGEKFYCHIGDCESVFKTRKCLVKHINRTKHDVSKSPIKVPQPSQRHSGQTIPADRQQIPVIQGYAEQSPSITERLLSSSLIVTHQSSQLSSEQTPSIEQDSIQSRIQSREQLPAQKSGQQLLALLSRQQIPSTTTPKNQVPVQQSPNVNQSSKYPTETRSYSQSINQFQDLVDQQPSLSGQQHSSISSRQQTQPSGKQIPFSSPSVQHYPSPCPGIKGLPLASPALIPPQSPVKQPSPKGKSPSKRIEQQVPGQQAISKFFKAQDKKIPILRRQLQQLQHQNSHLQSQDQQSDHRQQQQDQRHQKDDNDQFDVKNLNLIKYLGEKNNEKTSEDDEIQEIDDASIQANLDENLRSQNAINGLVGDDEIQVIAATPKFQCSFCMATLPSAEERQKHLAKFHMDIFNPNSSSSLTTSSFSSSLLSPSTITYSKQKPPILLCEFCHQVFQFEHNLNSHKASCPKRYNYILPKQVQITSPPVTPSGQEPSAMPLRSPNIIHITPDGRVQQKTALINHHLNKSQSNQASKYLMIQQLASIPIQTSNSTGLNQFYVPQTQQTSHQQVNNQQIGFNSIDFSQHDQ